MFRENQRVKLITLGSMCFALFMAMLDSTVVYVALPAFQTGLDADVSDLQWIIDAYSLFFASLLLTGGTLGDRLGRKRLFLIGLSIFTLGSVVCGAAPNLETLIVGRVIQGVGASGLLPNSLAILTHTFPNPAERAQAFGIWSAISGLAYVIGPFLGGTLVETLGWQSIFFLNVPIGIAGILLTIRFVMENKDPEPRPIDIYGQITWTLSLAILTYALIESGIEGWGSFIVLSLSIAALAGFFAFLLVERRVAHPMLPLQFFRNPSFFAANSVAFLVGFGMLSAFFVLSLFMQQVQGNTAIAAGLRFLPTTVSMILTAPIAGRLAGLYGSRFFMTLGMSLTGISLISFTLVDINTPYTQWWWMMLLIGIGIGCTMAPMTAAAMGTVPESRAGMASAVLSTNRESGGLFGIALLGAVVSGQFQMNLEKQLSALNVPEKMQEKIVSLALRGTKETSGVLEDSNPTLLKQTIGEAFVESMHTGLMIGGTLLIAGALIALIFVRQPAVSAKQTEQSQSNA